MKNLEMLMDVSNGKIISGFPGVGKSHFCQTHKFVSDSDSSKFPKDNFPANYIHHILNIKDNYQYVLVSSHAAVREALVDAEMFYTLVYPERGLKAEYLDRYVRRGSPEAFIDMMNKNWGLFIDGCETQSGCKHIVLKRDQFLVDVL